MRRARRCVVVARAAETCGRSMLETLKSAPRTIVVSRPRVWKQEPPGVSVSDDMRSKDIWRCYTSLGGTDRRPCKPQAGICQGPAWMQTGVAAKHMALY